MSRDVLLAYLHPEEVAASFHKSLLDLVGYEMRPDGRLLSRAEITAGPLGLPDGRNKACQALLDNPDCQWLFMVDADMGFEPHTLEALLHVADPETRPIIGGLCFAQRHSTPDEFGGFRCFPSPTILDWVQHPDGHARFTGRLHYPVNSLTRTGATGCACLLIHRSVIEQLAEKHGPIWFDQIRDPAPPHAFMGEDISFFARTGAEGSPLYIHTGIRTTHHKRIWLAEGDFWAHVMAPPATEAVDVIVPALHRPQNVQPLMESLRASTGLATAWFVCEATGKAEQAAARRHGAEVLSFPGKHTFAEKVNAAIGAIPDPAPWVLLVGDDVAFRPGWLDQAEDIARRYAADVVGTNDLANPRVMRGEHATHPFIRRSYIDEQGASWDGPGVVCHEGYGHWFVDDEIVTVAKQRGTFQPALASRVEHLHPINGSAPMDEVYAEGQKYAEHDRSLFEERVRKYLSA